MPRSKEPNTDGKYIDTLEGNVRERYIQKISLVGGLDPYEATKGAWSKDERVWPEVTFHDIYYYLVIKESVYTSQQMSAVKSLESYNYFVSGWVNVLGCIKIGDICLMSAKVRHSQRLNDRPLQPWILAQDTGTVLSAHCNCMAGLAEVCSHVGALLFAIETAVKVYNSKTVTQEKAYWKLPTSIDKVPYSKVEEIDFSSAKTKKKNLNSVLSDSSTPSSKQRPVTIVPQATEDELCAHFDKLITAGQKPACLSLHEQYSHLFVPTPLADEFPKLLSELRDENCDDMTAEELADHCESLMEHLEISEKQVRIVEKETREQTDDKLWHQLRTGRITSSVMKRVCQTSITNPAVSTVNSICYPNSKQLNTAAINWGRKHESTARNDYSDFMSDVHTNFSCETSGLCLNPKLPFLGASPDGIVSCACCGDGCLEIKCPYASRDLTVEDAIRSGKKFGLKLDNDRIVIDHSHDYYYQIQTQLFVTERSYCDFVVWTNIDCRCIRVEPDYAFWESTRPVAEDFFLKVVLPEIVAKKVSRDSRPTMPVSNIVHNIPLKKKKKKAKSPCSTPSSSADRDVLGSMSVGKPPKRQNRGNVRRMCVCHAPYVEDDEKPMIACDNENCQFEWLHFECIGMMPHSPDGVWFCDECKKLC